MIEGTIYRLDFEDGTCYVGSTTKKYLSQRVSNDKQQKSSINGYIQEVNKRLKDGMICISSAIKKDLFFNKYDLLYWERILTELTPNTLNKRRCWKTTEEEQERIKTTKKTTNKNYREKNKDKINEKKNQKFICECGVECQISTKARHIRSKFDQNFIINLK